MWALLVPNRSRQRTGQASITVQAPRLYQLCSLVSRAYQYSVLVPVLTKKNLSCARVALRWSFMRLQSQQHKCNG
jgi:hypothetical protein